MRLINAKLFALGAGSTVSDAVLLLMYAQIALIALCLILFAIFMLRKYLIKKRSNEMLVAQTVAEKKEHTLIGISLDVSRVKRNFHVGDAFDCDGLTVFAEYKEQPVTENVYDFSIMNAPMLYSPGTEVVTVGYGGFTATYTVNVEQAVPEAPSRALVYIELNLDEVKTEYKEGEPFDSYGLKVFAHYNSEPEVEEVYDFTVDEPDMSITGRTEAVVHYGDFAQTYPIFIERKRTLVGITLDLGIVRREFVLGEKFYADGLIVIANYDVAPFNERVNDYQVEAPTMETEGQHIVTVNYLNESAIYTITVIKPETNDNTEEVATTKREIVFEEESVDAGILRYDRSFTARFIQSDDDTKHWYTMIKNELLSYKKIKDRMSWKKETYKFGKEVIAKFGYRGKTLCLFLALDPAEFIDSKYKIEDVSENKSFVDTPCMYRIKNDRRVKYAFELIEIIMERIGAKRLEGRISQDYYMPYEGIVELINKKLVKRLIKSSADEAIFESGNERKEQSSETAATAEPTEPAEVAEPVEQEVAEENIDEPFSAGENVEENAAPAEQEVSVEENIDEPFSAGENVEENAEPAEQEVSVEENIDEPFSAGENVEENAEPAERLVSEENFDDLFNFDDKTEDTEQNGMFAEFSPFKPFGADDNAENAESAGNEEWDIPAEERPDEPLIMDDDLYTAALNKGNDKDDNGGDKNNG